MESKSNHVGLVPDLVPSSLVLSIASSPANLTASSIFMWMLSTYA